LSYWDVASGSVFFQFSLYIAVRLAHRGFTLGELGLVVFGATALFMELANLTVAKVYAFVLNASMRAEAHAILRLPTE
jgi:hypothetical protein